MTEEKIVSTTVSQAGAEKQQSANLLPDLKPGMVIKVHQKVKETDAKGETKERVQLFEGVIIACHGGKGDSATFTVRKIAEGNIGVEKIIPLHLPNLKVEIVKEHKVRRAKLYYLRNYGKKLKDKKAEKSKKKK
jgi:large subunit ribosomal protein L19